MDDKQKRLITSIVFWVAVCAFTLAEPGGEESYLPVVGFLVFGFTALAWVRFDARVREVEVGKFMVFGILLIYIVAVPVYMFRSRTIKQALAGIARFVGLLFLVATVAEML